MLLDSLAAQGTLKSARFREAAFAPFRGDEIVAEYAQATLEGSQVEAELGEEIPGGQLGVEIVLEAMTNEPAYRQREARTVYDYCASNPILTVSYDPAKMAIKIMRKAIEQDVAAAQFLGYFDRHFKASDLVDAIDHARAKAYGTSQAIRVIGTADWKGKETALQEFGEQVGRIFSETFSADPTLHGGRIDKMLTDAILVVRKRWNFGTVPPPGSKNDCGLTSSAPQTHASKTAAAKRVEPPKQSVANQAESIRKSENRLLDSEQLGETIAQAPLGTELVAEAMKSQPEERRREAEDIFAWCAKNTVLGQLHDPAQVAIRIMQEAIARDVSADSLLHHLDSLKLSDCLNTVGIRQYARVKHLRSLNSTRNLSRRPKSFEYSAMRLE